MLFGPQKYQIIVKAGQVSYNLSSSLNRPDVLRTKSEIDDELLHFVVKFSLNNFTVRFSH